jgi:hypothetical protein
MLLRTRAPKIEVAPPTPAKGYEHLPEEAVAVLSWLKAARVDFVLVGPVARAIRGERGAKGAVAIVPAPYGRNVDRLARALNGVKARPRTGPEFPGVPAAAQSGARFQLNGEQLLRAERWMLLFGTLAIDVEGRPAGSPSFQDVLYESTAIEVAPELSIEIAAPEDIEHYDHVRRRGVAPELKVSRLGS